MGRILLILLPGFSLFALISAQPVRDPVYVGSRVCASCHQKAGMGNQFSLWLLSKHARAYAVLAKPEAKQIAKLSGIPQEPQESAVCLGCHATGVEAEEWERDETFFIEDGVQCEKCHGPGSEYTEMEVMLDSEASMRAGLKMPTRRDCMVCHEPKGSHLAVHKLPALDIDEAWVRIAHPTPENPEYESSSHQVGTLLEQGNQPKYVGVMACAQCHKSPMMGYQFSLWRMSDHAKAYASLATPEALQWARIEGVEGNPQESELCLKCHVTGGSGPIPSLSSFSVDEGVGCESCHGPGSEYSHQAIMIDKPAAVEAGLQEVTRNRCMECHENAHDKPFDIDAAWSAIRHPTKQFQAAELPRYKTPLNLAISPDAKEIYVACEASDSVVVVDVSRRTRGRLRS